MAQTDTSESFDQFKERVKAEIIDYCDRNDTIYIKVKHLHIQESNTYVGRCIGVLEDEWEPLEGFWGDANSKTWVLDKSALSNDG